MLSAATFQKRWQRVPAHDDISSGLSAIDAEDVTLSGERSRRTLSTFAFHQSRHLFQALPPI